MYSTPLHFLEPFIGKRLLLCGVGVEAVGFVSAGAEVYGLDPLAEQVQAVKDLARSLGLRNRTYLQPMISERLAYPDEFFDLILGRTFPDEFEVAALLQELARVLKPGGRAAFVVRPEHFPVHLVERNFGSTLAGDGWIGVENSRKSLQSHWSDLNRRPLDYESRALPLSYSGGTSDALARIRTATPFGTTPSR